MSEVVTARPAALPSVVDLATRLNAKSVATKRIQIYIPNRDRDNNIIPDIQIWIDEAVRVFKIVNRGATVLPNLKGAWVDPDDASISIDETTAVVYSFIGDAKSFSDGLDRIHTFICKFGRSTNQREVLIEYDDRAIWIDDFSAVP